MKTVTQSYLEGIQEGRSFLNLLKQQGFSSTEIKEALQGNIVNMKKLIDRIKYLAYSEKAIDIYQGEIDFCAQQLEKHYV